MATGGGGLGGGGGGGGELRQTIGNTSDIAYEYACTLCVQKKGSYSEAASYCPECDVYYCRLCLQYICDHGCIGKAKMERWGKPIYRKTGQSCREHTGSLIQLYCGDDNEVCCHVCVAEKHQGCSKVVHIPTMASKQETRQHLEEAQRQIREMQSKLIDAKRDRDEKKKNLKLTYNRLKAEIQEFRRNMSDILEELEKQSINELNELERTINDQLNVESRASDHAQEEIESYQDKLKKQKSGIDDTDRFIWWKQSSKILQEAKNIVSDARPKRGTELMLLEFHEGLETCLKSLKGLGKLKPQHQPKTHKIDTPYTVETKDSFSIRNREDSDTCCISSMCQLSDGTFVLSDNTNSCLKRLNQSNTIMDRCLLPSSPYGICCTSDNEVAVALGNKIQFVSVKDSMTTTGVVNFRHNCYGLACMNNDIYVTSWGPSVYVYDTSGSLKKEYGFDESPRLVDDPLTCYSCISPDMNNIYITDPFNNQLLTIYTDGIFPNWLTPSDTKRLRDVCVDDVGNVFVCGVRSNTIIQIDATGSRKVADILQQADGIKRPMTFCFDRVNTRLLVACENSDIIHSLDLVQL